ncbi:hypothetical protein AGDE_14772 [Angomonas deanei]|uniref:DNA-directed RNA polymerase n=1 Tax=Angomonas deanei TaxID=59799 RepID=A0A7G2CAP7_9TRYP|nr:hypothetical protein AGDE_14772 [Angomonas deanei]CAD2216940.1 RNA polymerase Rpb1, domain 5, putative [Angomonas deanei]|eukprot:EPY20254.1 hypothetical protein AGDE_14772 [Angomonas deanei]
MVVKHKLEEAAGKPHSPLRPLLQPGAIAVVSHDSLRLYPSRAATTAHVTFFAQTLLAILPDVVVGGLPGVARVMLSADGAELLAEGTSLRAVMALPHVDGTKVSCNHIMEVEKVLGIEAARAAIVREISSILTAYSLTIDMRHIYLLADVMTSRGTVLGITRYGINKMNNNVLTMASFERTTEHLYNAAVTQRKDVNLSVSESIIIGKPIPLGTSSFSVLLSPGSLDVHHAEGSKASTTAETKRVGVQTGKAGAGDQVRSSFVEYDVHKDFARLMNLKYSQSALHSDCYFRTPHKAMNPLFVENPFRLNLVVQ